MKSVSCLLAVAFCLAWARAGLADVTGKVTLDGKAPEAKEINMAGVKDCAALHPDPVLEEFIVASDKGDLANVVVSVKADEAAALGGEVPKEPAVLDQKGCQYIPHVLGMMVGQKLLIKNDDSFAHNIHSLPQTNPDFNFMQPTKDPGKEVDKAPKAAENIKIKCDVHPWMGAWLAVFEHPFFAVSKEDGTFAIKGLPDGDYTIQAWHEKLGAQEGKVSVKGGKGEVNFKFKAPSASATPNGKDAAVATLDCCSVPTAPVAAAPVQTAHAR